MSNEIDIRTKKADAEQFIQSAESYLSRYQPFDLANEPIPYCVYHTVAHAKKVLEEYHELLVKESDSNN